MASTLPNLTRFLKIPSGYELREELSHYGAYHNIAVFKGDEYVEEKHISYREYPDHRKIQKWVESVISNHRIFHYIKF